MALNYSLDDMRLFCSVARTGSYKLAASRLNIPLSTLSRRVSALELQLGVRLLHRDAHRLILTETGQHYYSTCAPLFDEFEAAAQTLQTGIEQPRGELHISAPVDLTDIWLAPMLNAFAARYPEIRLSLQLSNYNIALQETPVDLAIRVGEQQDSDWVQRYIDDIPFHFYASRECPQWHQLETPKQLDEWPLITRHPQSHWKLYQPTTGEQLDYPLARNVRLRADHLMLVRRSIAAGLGVGLLPDWVECDIGGVKGKLTRVATDWCGVSRPIHLLYRDRRQQPRRLQLLIEHLLTTMRDPAQKFW